MWGRTFDSTEYPGTVAQKYPSTIRNGANWLGAGQDDYTYDGKRYHLVNNGQDWALDNGDLERGHDWITRQGMVPASPDVEAAVNDDVEPFVRAPVVQPQAQAVSNGNEYAYTRDQGVNNRIVDEDEEGFNRILNKANGWNIFRRSGMFRGNPVHDKKYADTNRRLRPKFEDAFDRFVREADPLNAGPSTADQYINRAGIRGYNDVDGGYNTANVNGYATNNGAIGNAAGRVSGDNDAVSSFINRYGPGSSVRNGGGAPNGGASSSGYNLDRSGIPQGGSSYGRGGDAPGYVSVSHMYVYLYSRVHEYMYTHTHKFCSHAYSICTNTCAYIHTSCSRCIHVYKKTRTQIQLHAHTSTQIPS